MANYMSSTELQDMCNNAKRLGFRPERLLLLNQRLEEWSKGEMTPSIVVKVLRHGETAFQGAYGTMGPGKGPDSLRDDAIFPVCSITKPVMGTILAIMQEEGWIDLNEPVRKYIPEFTGDKDGEVHIWHILTHTSGLDDDDLHKNFDKYITETLGIKLPDKNISQDEENLFFLSVREKMGLPFMEPGDDMRHQTYASVALTFPPTHKPQKVMSYCNFGYNLLMWMVKRLITCSVDEFFAEKLFKPCQMVDSHFVFPMEKLDRYVTREPEFFRSKWMNNGVLMSEGGAGGLKSTVHDMTRFGQMYLNQGVYQGKRVLSRASVFQNTSDHNSKISAASYGGETFESTWGLGWNIKGTKKDDAGMLRSARSFEHSGFGCTKLLCDPEVDLVVAYFTVCREDNYWNASRFNNMVIGALD